MNKHQAEWYALYGALAVFAVVLVLLWWLG
jgi:hypothetical protein